MLSDWEIRRLIKQPLDDVLKKLYSNSFMSWLYEAILEPLVNKHPELLSIATSASPMRAKKPPRKDDKVELLKTVLRDERLKFEFYALLPDPLKAALSALTWHGSRSMAAIELMTGEVVADLNPADNRQWHEPFIVRHPYQFICFLQKESYRYYGLQEFTKKTVYGHLPNAIRQLFRGIIPPPPDYELLPLDEPPPEKMRYVAADAIQELKAAAEFITQGHAKYTKNEQLSKVSVRKFRQVIAGKEFFDPAINQNAELIRTRMLLGVGSFAGDALRQSLLTATSAEPLKQILSKLSPAFLEEELLSHIRHSGGFGYYDRDIIDRLAKFAAGLPTGKWVSASNILSYFRYRNETPSVFESTPDNLRDSSTTSYDYHHRHDTDKSEFALISAPLLQGYAFLLASLGMAEIAYSTLSESQMTPFSSLEAVRLTPLGEFVFGKRQALDIEVAAVPRSEILLDSNRLMASCKHLDSLTELALKQFMERITEGRFRLTHKSLLGGCSSREALEERIALFRRVIVAQPPPIWEQFFTKTLNRIAPLKKESSLLVFKLDTDEEIRRLFNTDPVLRQHCLKVEGYRIAIERKDIDTVCKQLEKAGCLCPPAGLGGQKAKAKKKTRK